MYNYEFNSEIVLLESVDNLISINDKDIRGNILVTDKNLLIFKNIKENTVLTGRQIHEMPEYELIIQIVLKDLKYEIEDNNTIINIDDKELILFDFNLNDGKN